MRRIRQIVTCLCLATTLSVSAAMPAEPGDASAAEPAGTSSVKPAAKLDLSLLRGMTAWSSQASASPTAPPPMKVQMQTSQGGWAGLSTAKKTWIIVGSVLAVGVLVAAVSNHGGGGGGGGGGY
jgi:hypothetical protein